MPPPERPSLKALSTQTSFPSLPAAARLASRASHHSIIIDMQPLVPTAITAPRKLSPRKSPPPHLIIPTYPTLQRPAFASRRYILSEPSTATLPIGLGIVDASCDSLDEQGIEKRLRLSFGSPTFGGFDRRSTILGIEQSRSVALELEAQVVTSEQRKGGDETNDSSATKTTLTLDTISQSHKFDRDVSADSESVEQHWDENLGDTTFGQDQHIYLPTEPLRLTAPSSPASSPDMTRLHLAPYDIRLTSPSPLLTSTPPLSLSLSDRIYFSQHRDPFPSPDSPHYRVPSPAPSISDPFPLPPFRSPPRALIRTPKTTPPKLVSAWSSSTTNFSLRRLRRRGSGGAASDDSFACAGESSEEGHGSLEAGSRSNSPPSARKWVSVANASARSRKSSGGAGPLGWWKSSLLTVGERDTQEKRPALRQVVSNPSLRPPTATGSLKVNKPRLRPHSHSHSHHSSSPLALSSTKGYQSLTSTSVHPVVRSHLSRMDNMENIPPTASDEDASELDLSTVLDYHLPTASVLTPQHRLSRRVTRSSSSLRTGSVPAGSGGKAGKSSKSRPRTASDILMPLNEDFSSAQRQSSYGTPIAQLVKGPFTLPDLDPLSPWSPIFPPGSTHQLSHQQSYTTLSLGRRSSSVLFSPPLPDTPATSHFAHQMEDYGMRKLLEDEDEGSVVNEGMY